LFYELREYRIQPGRMADWVKVVEEMIIPFQTAKGMVVAGTFTDENDPEHYIWLRRFENEEERLRLYDAVYKADYWLNEVKPKVDELMIRSEMKVTRIVPTSISVLH